jgi:hypothetical protein
MTTLKDYGSGQLDTFRRNHPHAYRIGNNTQMTTDEAGVHTIRYHSTDILRVSAFRVDFNTGEWATVTTKARMNRAMPPGWRITQRQYVWYIDHVTTGDRFTVPGQRFSMILTDGVWHPHDGDGHRL